MCLEYTRLFFPPEKKYHKELWLLSAENEIVKELKNRSLMVFVSPYCLNFLLPSHVDQAASTTSIYRFFSTLCTHTDTLMCACLLSGNTCLSWICCSQVNGERRRSICSEPHVCKSWYFYSSIILHPSRMLVIPYSLPVASCHVYITMLFNFHKTDVITRSVKCLPLYPSIFTEKFSSIL